MNGPIITHCALAWHEDSYSWVPIELNMIYRNYTNSGFDAAPSTLSLSFYPLALSQAIQHDKRYVWNFCTNCTFQNFDSLTTSPATAIFIQARNMYFRCTKTQRTCHIDITEYSATLWRFRMHHSPHHHPFTTALECSNSQAGLLIFKSITWTRGPHQEVLVIKHKSTLCLHFMEPYIVMTH